MSIRPSPPALEIDPAVVALIHRGFSAFNTGDTDALVDAYAEDCIDHDPVPFQPPGRDGIRFKFTFFLGLFPDARTHVEDMAMDGEALRVVWTTAARGLGGGKSRATYRYAGRFVIRDGYICEVKILERRPA